MKRTLLLAWLVSLLLLLSAASPSTAQNQMPSSDEIAAYLRHHPLMVSAEAAVREVFFQGEALVIDLSQEILPEGTYDPQVFNQLQSDLDQAFQINQRFLVTFKIEGLTLEHWGEPLPDFDQKAEPQEIRELPGDVLLS